MSEESDRHINSSDVLKVADKFMYKMVVIAAALMDVELSVFFWLDPTSGTLRITHSHDKQNIGLESVSGIGAEGKIFFLNIYVFSLLKMNCSFSQVIVCNISIH